MKQNGIIVLLSAAFLAFFMSSNSNYLDVLAANDSLVAQLMESHESEGDTRDMYRDLEERYLELLEENAALSKEVLQLESRRELPTYSFSGEDVRLLALVALCEAGHGNVRSQRNVVSVVLNRVEDEYFPNTVREVVYQNEGGIPQFSVAYNGAMDHAAVTDEALQSVYYVLLFGRTLPEGVKYFYSDALAECGWIRTLPVHSTVEGTVFAYEKGALE